MLTWIKLLIENFRGLGAPSAELARQARREQFDRMRIEAARIKAHWKKQERLRHGNNE